MLRRHLWIRSQMPRVIAAVQQRLASALAPTDHGVLVNGGGGAGDLIYRPLAITHLRDAYLAGELTGERGDLRVWERVVRALSKDTRVEKTKDKFGNTERDAWMWTA